MPSFSSAARGAKEYGERSRAVTEKAGSVDTCVRLRKVIFEVTFLPAHPGSPISVGRGAVSMLNAWRRALTCGISESRAQLRRELGPIKTWSEVAVNRDVDTGGAK